jgi:Ca-activated chloride channel family protein
MIWGNIYWRSLIFIIAPVILASALLVIFLTNKQRERSFRKFSSERFFSFWNQGFIPFYWNLRTFLFALALVMLLVAIANPKWGKKETEYARSGIDIVYLLDVSKSMDINDISPSRLHRSLSLIGILSERLSGDRIALLTFAGDTNTVFSFTDNVKIANSMMNLVNTDDVKTMGTNIPLALVETNKLIERAAKKNVVVFLFSDGENLEQGESQIMEQIDVLTKRGARLYSIGVGTPKGQFLKDNTNVTSRLNEGLLTRIAEATGGSYIGLNKDTNALQQLEKVIQEYDKNRYSSNNPLFYKEQFWLPLSLAILLLLIETFIPYMKKYKLKFVV